ncbi:hypothetical protein AHAS_Ahas20G0142400 [Arachis hypogaea]
MVPKNQELAVRFGDLNVSEYVTVAGEGSSGSASTATKLLPFDLGVVPKLDPTESVTMEDME